ncbi:DNA polymerase IV [Achromobacter sp. F4_2707]|uniref:Y-family DNA polymerase n=1 Tax=Achromobacter sp. F4_2707 TaxID=3114286 RepID=UPI0039C5F0CD
MSLRCSNENQERRIAHLDMDAFYASVELLRYPELRGLPVVIGGRSATRPGVAPDGTRLYSRLGDYVGRGVITTATYEARALGVHSAMGLMKAARLAPDAILLPADFTQYRLYSRRFKEAVACIAPQIEDRGIDEIYLDLTGLEQDSLSLAHALKTAVREATGLSCSIGISPNKLLSKIASDLDKPDGITLIGEGDLQARIWPLPVGRINGIGPKAQARLGEMGIHTIGELAGTPLHVLVTQFSERYSHWLLEAAHGRDDRPVVVESTPKSVSRETTFERDLHVQRDRVELGRILDGLCERVADDLSRKSLAGRTIGVKVRFEDFRTVTRDLTLPQAITEAPAIRQAAGLCLKRIPMERRLRLLGVRVGALALPGKGDDSLEPHDLQLDLFS